MIDRDTQEFLAEIDKTLAEDRPFNDDQVRYLFAGAKEALELRDKLNIHESWDEIVYRHEDEESPVIKKIKEIKAEIEQLTAERDALLAANPDTKHL